MRLTNGQREFWNLVVCILLMLPIMFSVMLLPAIEMFKWADITNWLLAYFLVFAIGIQVLCVSRKVSFGVVDFVFVAFVLWHFASFSWATNPSVIWTKSITWTLFYGFYKIVESLNIKNLNTKNWVFVTAGVLLFNIVVLCWFYLEISRQEEGFGFSYIDVGQITKFVGFNPNYVASLLVLTMPLYILLWTNKRTTNIFLTIMAALQILLLFGLNSRGALLALVIQLLFFASFNLKRLKKILWLLPILLLIPVVTLLFVEDKQNYISQYNPFKDVQQGHDERLLMWKSAIKIWKESIWTGKGAGNWPIEHPKYAQDLFYGYDGFAVYSHAHSIYFELLSELGIVGLVLYLFIIFYFLSRCARNIRKRKDVKVNMTLMLMIIGYIILSAFFGIVWTKHYHINIIQLILIGVFGVGSIYNEKRTKIKCSRYTRILFVVCIGCSFYHTMTETRRKFLTWSYLHLRVDKKYDKTLPMFEKLYNPLFYQIAHPSHSRQVSLRMYKALDLWAVGRKTEALSEIIESINEQPYHIENWFHRGNMHLRLGDLEDAVMCYKRVYELNPTFVNGQIKLLETYIHAGNQAEAKHWYEFIKDHVQMNLERQGVPDLESWSKARITQYEKHISYEKKLLKLKDKVY